MTWLSTTQMSVYYFVFECWIWIILFIYRFNSFFSFFFFRFLFFVKYFSKCESVHVYVSEWVIWILTLNAELIMENQSMAVELLALVKVLQLLQQLCLDGENCAVDRHALDVVLDIVLLVQEALPIVPAIFWDWIEYLFSRFAYFCSMIGRIWFKVMNFSSFKVMTNGNWFSSPPNSETPNQKHSTE